MVEGFTIRYYYDLSVIGNGMGITSRGGGDWAGGHLRKLGDVKKYHLSTSYHYLYEQLTTFAPSALNFATH